MLDGTHLLFILISALVTAVLCVVLHHLRRPRLGHAAVVLAAVGTVALHYSPLWVSYLTTGTATVAAEMLFLIYPCHICMWLLVLSSALLQKEDPLSRLIKDFTFWGGTVCGTIGLVLNENYDLMPDLSNYNVLKGLLSHSVMILGCVLLLVLGHVRIRVGRGLAAVVAGLALFYLSGLFVNALFAHYGLPSRNAMYLESTPYPALPWINSATVALAALAVVFLSSALYEWLALPREERWYRRLMAVIKKHR